MVTFFSANSQGVTQATVCQVVGQPIIKMIEQAEKAAQVQKDPVYAQANAQACKVLKACSIQIEELSKKFAGQGHVEEGKLQPNL